MVVKSHFHLKPKLRLGLVDLRLGWGFDNIICISLKLKFKSKLVSLNSSIFYKQMNTSTEFILMQNRIMVSVPNRQNKQFR